MKDLQELKKYWDDEVIPLAVGCANPVGKRDLCISKYISKMMDRAELDFFVQEPPFEAMIYLSDILASDKYYVENHSGISDKETDNLKELGSKLLAMFDMSCDDKVAVNDFIKKVKR